uniref:Secreted protein n=1 Tax=Arundo donax TaxID=35708 RepID=A0A0A9ECR7_ARUDO
MQLCLIWMYCSSTIVEVTTVTITVTGRKPIVPGGRSKRVAEKVVPPGQILIFLAHAHPLYSSSL